MDPWDKDADKMFEFGGVKAAQNCIDKVDNACEGDVSFLLDVCRWNPAPEPWTLAKEHLKSATGHWALDPETLDD